MRRLRNVTAKMDSRVQAAVTLVLSQLVRFALVMGNVHTRRQMQLQDVSATMSTQEQAVLKHARETRMAPSVMEMESVP